MLRFADLKYSKEELEQDAIHYLKTQVYEPSYIDDVKEFIADDLSDFKNYYDDEEYAFQSVYYDEYVDGYTEKGDNLAVVFDFNRLSQDLETDFSAWGMGDEEIEQYVFTLDSEFRKNACCSHMEPYFLGYDSVVATVMTGYSRDPIFSIYSMVREWAMALHLKKMYPTQMRKFGYRYQFIKENFKGEERLKYMLDFRDRYKITLRSISMLRSVHSSVFAYIYLYLRAFLFGETEEIEEFIMDTASSQLFLLLQGEDVQIADFPIVKHALRELKNGRCKEMIFKSGAINWDAVYEFVDEMIQAAGGMENLRAFGFDGIQAKTIRAFWNKSANMQKMLKILRQLAMGNSDPIIQRLIEMCEYRLGRPDDKSKKKMERFIEQTRRLMVARAYELTQPRTMDQMLISAFPSVFLVYFQWHHNFRKVYPKVPPQKVAYENNQKKKQQAEDTLKKTISYEDERTKIKNNLQEESRRKSREQDDLTRFVINENSKKNSLNEDKMRSIMQNRDNTLTNHAVENRNRQDTDMAAASLSVIEQSKKQNSL
ncbi:MAG: hypothetical protein IJS88_01840 [Alphaproteobacteria bacterium]|nr:hypothetical protein [Alphaproteobacteria bacterium]